MSSSGAYTVIVGVDGSAASKTALRWAVWHAGLVNGNVTALMAWDYSAKYTWEGAGPEMNHAAVEALSAAVDEVADFSLEVRQEVSQGAHPAKALLDASREADLLVVGSRGHGGFMGALLGSVSQHCIHHATCPVLVVRGQ